MADREFRDIQRNLSRSPKKPTESTRASKMGNYRQHSFAMEWTNEENGRDEVKVAAKKQILPSDRENLLSHPIYREISVMNGRINRMDMGQLKRALAEKNMNNHGKRDTLKRRLKEHLKVEKLVEAGLMEASENRNVDYFVVIDFEATCEEKNPPGFKHEIIEFPAVLVASADPPHIVDIFHSYVRPVINPVLSDFCRNLTGITQKTVDEAQTFETVHERFVDWLEKKHELGSRHSYSIVTDGPFDMGRFLYLQMMHVATPFPAYGSFWVNLRKSFANFYKEGFYNQSSNSSNKLPGLHSMLQSLGMEFQGQPHCGRDDAKNIARVLIRLIGDRAFVRINEKIIIKDKDKDSHDTDYHARLKCVTSVTRPEAESVFRKQKKMALKFRENSGPESLCAKMENVTC